MCENNAAITNLCVSSPSFRDKTKSSTIFKIKISLDDCPVQRIVEYRAVTDYNECV